MGTFFSSAFKASIAALASFSLAGCVSFRPIEPVLRPPAQFEKDATVAVEFVNPMAIGMRCAQRGVKFLMLPGINANACSNPEMMTMPNPCDTFTGGVYAEMLCYELARSNGWRPEINAEASVENTATMTQISTAAPQNAPKGPPAKYRADTLVPIEFLAPEKIAYRCAERGAKMVVLGDGKSEACANSDLITMPNPCAVKGGGWYAINLCHELAHGNGWPADHRGGSFLAHEDEPQIETAPKVDVVAQALDEAAKALEDAKGAEEKSVETPSADTPALPVLIIAQSDAGVFLTALPAPFDKEGLIGLEDMSASTASGLARMAFDNFSAVVLVEVESSVGAAQDYLQTADVGRDHRLRVNADFLESSNVSAETGLRGAIVETNGTDLEAPIEIKTVNLIVIEAIKFSFIADDGRPLPEAPAQSTPFADLGGSGIGRFRELLVAEYEQ